MRRLLRALAAGALLLAVAARWAMAQTAGTANLLSSPEAWPSTGAASATTALGMDASAIFLNPAGLATQDERTVLLQHGLLQFDTSWDLAAVSYPVPGLGAFGLGVARVGTSGIDAYDAMNRPLGGIGYDETSLAASVARRVVRNVTAGATFKVLSQSLGDVSAAAPSLDLGFVFRPDAFRGGQAGFAAENVFGGSLDLGGPSTPVARALRLGLASPEWRLARLTGARAVIDLSRQGSEGMRSRFGVELTRAGIGAVRAGLNAGRPLAGVGIQWRRYGLDLAMEQGQVEATQQIALHVAWGEPVSQYEARRRAEYTKEAEDSLLARRATQVANDRSIAEAAETRGDWETALVLWEVLARELPNESNYANRADRARQTIASHAKDELAAEGNRRLASTFAALSRDALQRGDIEEAEGLWHAYSGQGMAATGVPPESLATLSAELEAGRARATERAVARADSLRAQGLVLEAADEAARALRLSPDDSRAQAVWAALQALVGKSAGQAQALGKKLDALTAIHEASIAFNEGRYDDATAGVKRALAIDPGSPEAREWRDRIQRRLATPKPEVDARVKQLYIKGMEAFTAGDYREALRNWEQILVLDPLNESVRRNVLEARDRMKTEARR
jgi:tetratricopeptide (TPR) repeat protein